MKAQTCGFTADGLGTRIAMLAFSTCGSSEHESIDVIRAGIELVRQRRPENIIMLIVRARKEKNII